jgi:hypothetical protein
VPGIGHSVLTGLSSFDKELAWLVERGSWFYFKKLHATADNNKQKD